MSVPSLNRSVYLSSGAKDFCDYTLALTRVIKSDLGADLRFARAQGMSPRVLEMLEFKAPVEAGSTDGWASDLALIGPTSQGFLSLLPPHSAFDRLVDDRAVTPMEQHTKIGKAQSAAVASYVGEGVAKLLSKITTSEKVMPPQKVVAIIAYNKELSLTNGSLVIDLFNNMLRNAVASETDRRFLEIIGTGTGVNTIASSGMTADAFMHDLNVALREIDLGIGARPYLILPMREFNTVSLLRDNGGPLMVNNKIGNITVIPTSAETDDVPVTDAVLLDSTSIGANRGMAVPSAASETTLEMSDDPTAGSTVTSLWQTNRFAARVERYFGACTIRPESIVVISDLDVTV